MFCFMLFVSVVHFASSTKISEHFSEGQTLKTTCPVKFILDKNPERIPEVIPRYICARDVPCSLCTGKSKNTCEQLWIQMNTIKSGQHSTECIEAGCVCNYNFKFSKLIKKIRNSS